MIGHALFALEHLPDDPGDLRRDDLPVLLAAIQGQRRLYELRRAGLVQALADADLDALRDLAASAEASDAAFAALQPYWRHTERMRAATPTSSPASTTHHN